jgi:hypothetical protein
MRIPITNLSSSCWRPSDQVPIFPGSKPPLPFTKEAFDEMDADLFKTIGRDRIITPDLVRAPIPRWRPG